MTRSADELAAHRTAADEAGEFVDDDETADLETRLDAALDEVTT